MSLLEARLVPLCPAATRCAAGMVHAGVQEDSIIRVARGCSLGGKWSISPQSACHTCSLPRSAKRLPHLHSAPQRLFVFPAGHCKPSACFAFVASTTNAVCKGPDSPPSPNFCVPR